MGSLEEIMKISASASKIITIIAFIFYNFCRSSRVLYPPCYKVSSSYFQQLLMLKDKDFVYIENCDNVVLELTQNLQHKIKYLHLINSQNVTLVFSKNALEYIDNL